MCAEKIPLHFLRKRKTEENSPILLEPLYMLCGVFTNWDHKICFHSVLVKIRLKIVFNYHHFPLFHCFFSILVFVRILYCHFTSTRIHSAECLWILFSLSNFSANKHKHMRKKDTLIKKLNMKRNETERNEFPWKSKPFHTESSTKIGICSQTPYNFSRAIQKNVSKKGLSLDCRES